MKNIFIVTGRTGAGKSTLCKRLEEAFNYPLFSFASMGKSFSNKNGYNRIRQCHLAMELNEFKEKLSNYILNIIEEQINNYENIIIDGLYIDESLKRLKENYDCKVIYLKIDDNIRYGRIASRLSITIEQAQVENKIKEQLKDDVGINYFIKNADFIIDGTKSIDDIFVSAKQYIKSKKK